MPKCLIDYSNTIIYKIFCKDVTVKDIYVGHTTNITKRKYQHKTASKNETNDLKIYKVIRDNGGWDNWNMIEIAKYNCKNATEARIKEQEHYELLNTTLNSVPPYVDTIEKYCFICKVQCNTPKEFEKHINSNKHSKISKMQNIENSENNDCDMQISKKIYTCKKCGLITYKKTDFNRHILTSKHNSYETNIEYSESIYKTFICEICDKEYCDRTGLWRHKKKCKLTLDKENEEDSEICDKKLIIALLKQNTELIEIIKNSTNNNTLTPLQT